jgi:hypothetical protein
VGEKRNKYMILVGKPKGKKQIVRSRCRCEDNIKIGFKEIERDGVAWIYLGQDRDRWPAGVKVATKLWVLLSD